MAMYEYRCRVCDANFEVRRSMAEADAPTPCPDGHTDTVRLLSVFASVRSAGATLGAGEAPAMQGGGCCGGACGCG